MSEIKKSDFQIVWETEAVRSEIAPHFEKSENTFSIIADNDIHSFGKWIGSLNKLDKNSIYTISVNCDYSFKSGKILVFLTWYKADKTMLSRDYFVEATKGNFCVSMECPLEADMLKIELCFCSYGIGSVHFGIPQIALSPKKPHRIIKAASAYLPFSDEEGKRTLEKNLEDIINVIDMAGNDKDKPDILCFTETAYDRRVPIPFQDKFIKPDSFVLELIKSKAKQYKMYLVFGIHENDNGRFYNCAYLISPQGSVIGKYRKTHITLSEYEDGMMAGNEFPVFDTDIGRIGIMICWDQWFPECARMLHLKRPDIIFVQTAGDTDCQIRSRAAETGAHVVVSGVIGIGSCKIINPYGEVIASNKSTTAGYICAKVDIDKKYYQYWLSVGAANGEGKDIYLNERRSDLY